MIILSLIFILFNSTPTVYAVNTNNIYAQVMNENVYFFKTPVADTSYDNVFFILPKTYFVILTESANDDFYTAKYSNLDGYVKKNEVQAISGKPSTPFLQNVNFRVYSELSCQLMSKPTLNSTQITTIPVLTKNIIYIASTKGDTLIEDRTNLWIYCKYAEGLYGYVYSDFCDGLPNPMPTNSEQVTYIPNPTFSAITKNQALPENDNKIGIIIGILSIPAIIFVFMIFQGSKILSKEKTKRQEIKEY